MWLSGYASFTRLSPRFHNGWFTRPLPLLYSHLPLFPLFILYILYIASPILSMKKHAISSACLIFLLIETVSSHPRNRSWFLQKQLLYLSSRKVRWCGIHIPERAHYHNLLSVRRIH